MNLEPATFNVTVPADLSALYKANFRFARFAARRLGASDGEADDLAQEAFMRLLKSGGIFSEKSARAYLAIAVRTLVIDQARSYRQRNGVSYDAMESGEYAAPMSEATGDHGKELQIAAVGQALDRISSDDDRCLLTWFYRDGKSAKDIATRTGQAISSVTCRLSRLRTKYREVFVAAVESADSSLDGFILSLQESHQY